MADTHGGHGGGHDGHGDLFKTYMAVAIALAVCTASSFAVNLMFQNAKVTAFVLILGVALIKTYLVGTYFMHLKWDWNMLYFLIGPAFIMGAMMAVVFLPDALIGPIKDGNEALVIAEELAKKSGGGH
jgi:caa(3)-type oxidase subunit IV